MPPFSLRFLVFAHLLWTAVLTGLTLVLSARYPYPETARWFRLTLIFLAVTALSPIPLLWKVVSLLWVPPATFVLAIAAFLVYTVMVAREHLDHLRGQR